ncbi:glutamine ABC transporter ATP-binding protein [Candidatus Geothermarchaeota archaeon]|nr:MAG: glutamine ABC transporter ATP-binding protein [Candidatus Geothermarchaeota archaeon]HEW93173.1 amino acid ABC transporter ATP-binding protein [Thermoprotei archaeon]
MISDTILNVVDLHKKYGDSIALDGVSFRVRKGETKVIIGPNGSGKTTLLKCLNLLVKPDKGRIWLGNIEITDPRININKIRRKIGFVFQDFNLFHHLTVLNNVMIGLVKVRKLKKHQAYKKAVDALSTVGLDNTLYHKYPAQLSGGQKQRVAIARALAMDPVIMLYDEPTSSLDPQFVNEVLQVIRKLAKNGVTSIIVTHQIDFALEIADEIIVMHKGRIIESGRPTELLSNPQNILTKKILIRNFRTLR